MPSPLRAGADDTALLAIVCDLRVLIEKKVGMRFGKLCPKFEILRVGNRVHGPTILKPRYTASSLTPPRRTLRIRRRDHDEIRRGIHALGQL